MKRTSVLRRASRTEGRSVKGSLVKGEDGVWREETPKVSSRKDAFGIDTLPKPKRT